MISSFHNFLFLLTKGQLKHLYIVMQMTTAKQQFGKHITGVKLSTTEGHPQLGNGPTNIHSRETQEKCFLWGLCQGNIQVKFRSWQL
jgi:hypothetical protein